MYLKAFPLDRLCFFAMINCYIKKYYRIIHQKPCFDSSCNSCMEDTLCGFCYVDVSGVGAVNGSCAPVATDSSHTIDSLSAGFGRCTQQALANHTTPIEWAYDYCPTDVSWMALAGLILYLACFAPGKGYAVFFFTFYLLT